MKDNKFFLLGYLSFICTNANAVECFLFYDGLNPLKQSSPFIERVVSIKEKQKKQEKQEIAQKRLYQAKLIRSLSADEYLKSWLSGKIESSFIVSGKEYNLLDFALINGAKENVVEELFQLGFNVSKHTVPFLLNSYNYKKAIDIIDRMSIAALGNILILDNKKYYSIANYFLLMKNFKAIKYLESRYGLNIN